MKYSMMIVDGEIGSMWKGEVFICLNRLRHTLKTCEDDSASGL
jgi:hypothetical protein